MNQKISEQAVLFGGRTSLVGIVTRVVSAAPAVRPAIVILNTGIIHRVGHHRMFVIYVARPRGARSHRAALRLLWHWRQRPPR